MLKPVENAARRTRLVDTGAVRVQGADAVKFLQGQVSNDVTRLTADRSVLAGLHNAQGRAIAVLRLVLAGPDEILALVPRELAAAVAARLGKFVLRSKVKISDASAEWDVSGVIQPGSPADALAAASAGAARTDEDGRIWICVATGGDALRADAPPRPDDALRADSGLRAHPAQAPASRAPAPMSRWLVLAKVAPLAEPSGDDPSAALPVGGPGSSSIPLTPDDWLAADIAAGLPHVYAATSEAFVAQMLNLDLLDGIAFDKGCYTGQEVIARAHYRGRVKRRMQRFRTREPAKLNPNDSGTLADGRTFKVVAAVQLSDGTSEFLAVAPMTPSATIDDDAQAAHTTDGAPLNAEQLALPYPLPT